MPIDIIIERYFVTARESRLHLKVTWVFFSGLLIKLSKISAMISRKPRFNKLIDNMPPWQYSKLNYMHALPMLSMPNNRSTPIYKNMIEFLYGNTVPKWNDIFLCFYEQFMKKLFFDRCKTIKNRLHSLD